MLLTFDENVKKLCFLIFYGKKSPKVFKKTSDTKSKKPLYERKGDLYGKYPMDFVFH